jgi:transcriptional regulator with XRE-family HTH domain
VTAKSLRRLAAIADGRAAARDGRLRELRVQAGLSQSELAEAVGVTRATIARWELGIRSPARREAERLTTVLNLLRDRDIAPGP